MGTLTSPIASRRFRLAVLVLSTAACAVSALYFGYLKGLDTVYTHFFYVPIILGGLWFDKKAVVVAALLGGVYLTSLHASGAGVEVDDLMRACVMVLMAFVVGIISARRSRAEKALADYRHRLEQMVSDRTVELSDANEKLRLLGGMTRHDLLNQLSILVGWLELARESRPDGKSCKELERAAESAEVIREDLQFAADYERIGLIRPTWVSASHSFLMGASRFKLSDILMTNDLGALEVLADPMVEKVFTLSSPGSSVKGSDGFISSVMPCEEEPLFCMLTSMLMMSPGCAG